MSLRLSFVWTGSKRCHSEINPLFVALRYSLWLGFGSHMAAFVTKEKSKNSFVFPDIGGKD